MSNENEHRPPSWADRFLRWYCNPKLLEQIQGDVHELFYWRLEEEGLQKANKSFIWDVLRLFRWSNIKRSSKTQKLNNMGMIKNYFKIGIRNLWKQRLSSTINVLGLSIALACSIVAFKWIDQSYIKDLVHENREDVFLVTHWQMEGSDPIRNGALENQVTKEIISSVPGIDKHTRYSYQSIDIRIADYESPTYAYFVDESYLDIFSFELVTGNLSALEHPDKIIISEASANRFFGSSFVVDEKVELKIGEEWRIFTVGAVLKNKPRGSSLQNYLLLSYRYKEQINSDIQSQLTTHFFIQRQKGVEVDQLEEGMDSLVPLINKESDKDKYDRFQLEPLPTMARNSSKMLNGVGSSPELAPNVLLGSIALFMIILSVFNFINISLAMNARRLKEIGVRKVIGGKRKDLVTQFLLENFLLCTLSLFIGILFAGSIMLPAFNEITNSTFTLNIFRHQSFWIFLVSILVFVTLCSGIYPAIVASTFMPINIFRKAITQNGNRKLSSFLLTFQLILAMVTIVAAIMFVHTNKVNENIDWGYDQYNKLVVNIPDSSMISPLKSTIAANPNVVSVSGTDSNVGWELNGKFFENEEFRRFAQFFQVGVSYPNALGLEVLHGRMFDPSLDSDLENTLIVNETFMRDLRLEFDPDGTKVYLDSADFNIIGVVKDFYYWPPDQRLHGVAMKAISASKFDSYLVQLTDADSRIQRDEIEDKLSELFPDIDFNVVLQEDAFNAHFRDAMGIQSIILFTAFMAILIATTGLYGLLKINLSSQLKMYGIRKVLGANIKQLGETMLKRFRWVFLVSVIIGIPSSMILIDKLLSAVYDDYPKVGSSQLILSVIILLAVCLFTFNFQIQHIKRINPADTLRTE